MADEITLGTIMEHLQALEMRMNKRFDNVDGRIDRLERNLTRQIEAIDKRLDAVEIEQLPKRVSRIEKHLGMASAIS